ncbi:hypothetical protein IFM89_029384 [Coptis chinensis]|uniref:Chlorophyll a-b binding protein, chloroplastic n=1 Tax=Coptis chinensis TaxID=261450 RepID=A0A835IN94_9MAGN|nr:hypothetical protein IFM89_029384 [Coptis chinensis]
MAVTLLLTQKGEIDAKRFQAQFGFDKKKATPKKVLKPTTDRPLWFPGAKTPEYLDGTLKLAGDIIRTRFEDADIKSTPFQPYNEVFGLQRFRECELIHGRWAMLATLGAFTVESTTGVTRQDTGKVVGYLLMRPLSNSAQIHLSDNVLDLID